MDKVLKLEELAMTVMGIYLLTFNQLGIPVWIWFILFFAPDVSMLGYLFNAKVGSISYNVFHHKGIAIAIAAVGYFMNADVVLSAGILLFAHASFDRVFGYGLKYYQGFNVTHLGVLRGAKNGNEHLSSKSMGKPLA